MSSLTLIIVMERSMNTFDTLSDAMSWLKQQGYDLDFNTMREVVTQPGTTVPISPEEFFIEHVFRFEGDSDPGDEAILYGISAPRFGIKGIFVDGYGVSSDSTMHDMIKRLDIIQEAHS